MVPLEPRRGSIRRSASPLTGATVVDRLDRLTERLVQIDVLLGDLAELADQPPDPELADLLGRLADRVDAMVERIGHLDDELDALVAGPAADVRDLRADAETEPAGPRDLPGHDLGRPRRPDAQAPRMSSAARRR